MNEQRLIELFAGWLGAARIDAALRARYRDLFLRVTRYDPTAPYDTLDVAFESFVALADVAARAQLADTTSAQLELVPFFARTRDPMTGLRRGEMGSRVALDLVDERALERALMRVPGIGGALARRMTEWRRAQGGFTRLADLLDVADEPRHWNAIYPWLTLTSTAAPEPDPPWDFPEYVTWRESRAQRQGPVSATERVAITLRELEAVASRRGYWTSGRVILSRSWERRRDARVAVDRAYGHEAEVAFVTGKAYLNLICRLVRRAERSVHVLVPRVRVRGAKRIAALLADLARAAERGVDVRVMVGDSQLVGREALRAAAVNARVHVSRRSPDGAKRHRLHESTLVADDRHFVSGTQSWTPNAIYRAVELSTYAASPTLAAAWHPRFEALWNAGKPV